MESAPTGQNRTQMVQYVHLSWKTCRSTPNMSKAKSGQVPTQPAQDIHFARSKRRVLFFFSLVTGISYAASRNLKNKSGILIQWTFFTGVFAFPTIDIMLK